MWRRKKFIIIGVLATVLIASACTGGVVLAQTGDESGSQSQSKYETLLGKVCEIYQEKTGVTIDQAALQDAFTQAESEMRTEVLKDYLQNLVEQGKITQEQADQYLNWWQAKPDVPIGFGFGGRGGFPGMGGMRGWGGPCPFIPPAQ